ncbi:DUF4111 domain-containing protein [Escherichia coli]|uniref:aminoglycoside adenylyltransferase family protein n=1 Tax=Gammaproteobacteria TaxID=1236 RepID=UPI000B7E07D2|nr:MULTISPECIES: aminoglycoside adenylyltransferase family protein [Gammaproteobacteria]EAA8855156.1 DUF4111 domain-containing protein [Salmonella enterica]EDS4247432.1 DUF4111 domain-containing protein [Salmonella enterica subsp. enterica serovar Anatum]EFA4119652.1 DUF4111 domain-containing protein [Escherichia coli O14]EFN8600555.1 DUF4111 domain-containing protein [Escherichia coli O79:H40]HAX0094881.1 DUF4111 domain-containing protein [Escherichia coli CD311]
MQEATTEIPKQARAVLDTVRGVFEDALLAVYLHGSAVSGGLRPQSDIDLLVVIDRPMTEALRKSLLAALLRVSGRHPASPGGPRCIEVMLFQKSELAVPGFPARADFIYGEWLRDALEAGELPMPVTDPEITLVLAQARKESRPLFGPDAADLLPEIPAEHIRHAMRDSLPALLNGLHGDERNVLLTLARMWHTATTGKFISKDAAATWAMPHLPEPLAEVVACAREAYLGRVKDDWGTSQADARQTANHLYQQVITLLKREESQLNST